MAKLQIALCFLLVSACVVQGEGIFDYIDSALEFGVGVVKDLLATIETSAIPDATCTSSDIEELSSSNRFNNSLACLAKLRTGLESQNATDVTELLGVIDNLDVILTEGASCATEDSWTYLICYLNTIAKFEEYSFGELPSELLADLEVLSLDDELISLLDTCEATILDIEVFSNIIAGVEETVACVKNLS